MSEAPQPGARGEATPERMISGLLELARTDPERARLALERLEPVAQAAACVRLPARKRAEFLELLERPEEVVPLLPEPELVFAIRAGNMSDAGWLLELATEEQRIACVDLDCFGRDGLEVERFREWFDALLEAGLATLVSAVEELDLEIWVRALQSMAEVSVFGGEAIYGAEGFTEDGVVFFLCHTEEDEERIRELVRALLDANPRLYWQLAYGAIYEHPSECDEWARRWQTGRLEELGFPERSEAMGVYRPLAAADVDIHTSLGTSFGTQAPCNPGGVSDLPATARATLLAEALAALSPEHATQVRHYLLAVANRIAVADGARLSDPDAAGKATEKALRGIDLGLRAIATTHALPAHEVLLHVTPVEIFRVGVTVEPTLRRG